MRVRYFVSALFLFLVLPSLALSATFLVTKTEDTSDGVCSSTDCSLREAVTAANGSSEPDEIMIPAGTYLLTLTPMGEDAGFMGDLDLKGEMKLTGAGRGATFIDGNQLDRVFHVQPFATVEITGVTIQNGLVTSDLGGGGVLNEGSLHLRDSAIINCRVDGISLGGGLSNRAEAYLGNLEFSGNSSSFAGAAYNLGSLAVLNSTFKANVATGSIGSGGALMNGGALYLARSVITENTAKSSGGISNGGDLKIEGCEISGNQALWGGPGGIYSSGTMEIANTTVAANTATSVGGGVYAGGLAAIAASTIALNQPDGLYATGYVSLTGSLLTGNVFGNCVKYGNGVIDDFGYNLDSLNTCGLTGTGSLVDTDPLIGLLSDNGGATRTLAPGVGSPTIDAGKPGGPEDAWPYLKLTADQRGNARPAGAAPDIGALEVGAAAPEPTPLELTVVGPVGQLIKGANFTYHLKVRNKGAATARDLRVLHYLPAGVGAAGGTLTLPGGITTGAYPPVYKIETLAPGAEADIEVIAMASLPGRFNLRAALTAAGQGSASDHFAALSLDVVEKTADLAASISAMPQAALVGENVVYTITVENLGPDSAEGVTLAISDTPTNAQSVVSLVSEQGSCTTGTTLTCSLGTLDAGRNVTVTLTTTPLYVASISTSLLVSSIATDPVSTNNGSSVVVQASVPQSDFELTSASSPEPITATFVYSASFTVKNLGPDEGEPAVAVTLGATSIVTALTPSKGVASNNNGVVTFTPGVLALYESATIIVSLIQPTPAPVVHFANVTSAVVDPNAANDFTSLALDVVPPNPGTLSFVNSSLHMDEDAASAVLEIMRTGGSAGELTVSIQTANGTAIAGSDYVLNSATLTWPDGYAGTRTFSVTLINDSLAEPEESFSVTMTGTDLYQTAMVSINANDAPPASSSGGGGGGGGGCFIGTLAR